MVCLSLGICCFDIFLASAFLLLGFTTSEEHGRVKRTVLFTKNSKMFFRLNGKDNVIPWSQIFAHGWAFRVTWDLPQSIPRRHEFFKRDIHEELKDLDTLSDVKPYSCIIKYFCELTERVKNSNTCGVLCEIGKIINRQRGSDANFFKSIVSKCDYYSTRCPYTFSHVSPYTDL